MTTKKDANKEFEAFMEAGVKNLVDHHKFHKATNHVEFDADKLVLPDGVTLESVATHADFINTLSLQAEAATSQLNRALYGENNNITSLDSSLKLGKSLDINSTHHLQQQVGKEYIYGGHTTAVEFHHTQAQADWLSVNRAADHDLASKLFADKK